MSEYRLYLSLSRNSRGTRLTLTDTRTHRQLTLPAYFMGEILRSHVPREVIRQLMLVQRSWSLDAGHIATWVESPPDTAEWITEATARSFGLKARPGGGRVELEVLGEGGATVDEDAPGLDQLKRCTEFGLHHWRPRRPQARDLVCSFCSASYARLRLDGSSAASLVRLVVDSHLWKVGNQRYYGAFQKPDVSAARLPLRLLVDVDGIGRLHPQVRREMDYLVASAEPPILELVALPDSPSWTGIASLEFGTNKDVNRETRLHVVVHDFELPENRDLGPLVELQRLERDLGGGEEGTRRAFLLSVARVSSHALVTIDGALLDRTRGSRDATVLTPQVAVILAGIRFRYADRVPVPQFDHRVHLSMRTSHFNQARPLALVPEFADFFASLLTGIEQKRYPERAGRLFRGCLSRLSLLAEAEDHLAFLWHFPQERSAADDDTWYHLEFLLMVAQALLEALKLLAADIEGIPEDRVFAWRGFMEELSPRNRQLHTFLSQPPGRSVLEVVRSLRRPLAHSEHWWGTSHVGGSTDPTLVSQLIPGDAAAAVPRAIVQMREEPQDWGLSAWEYDVNDPEIQLQGYPFAISLNVRLLWFAREFMRRLRLDSTKQPTDAAARRRDPWAMTNPPLDRSAHDVIRMMTWPLPD